MNETMRLENWFVAGEVLFGNVYNNPNFIEGEFVRTSLIRELTSEKVITKNSTYILGKPSQIEVIIGTKHES